MSEQNKQGQDVMIASICMLNKTEQSEECNQKNAKLINEGRSCTYLLAIITSLPCLFRSDIFPFYEMSMGQQ